MDFLYRTFLLTAHFVHYADGGICFTKMVDSLCYTETNTNYFAADNGRLCCNHYDAVGYTDSNSPSYTFNLQTNRHYTSCLSCTNYIESESVVCFTRARHNSCWSEQKERKASPKACCENNFDGGYSRNLTVFINPEGYVAHYSCTSCNRLHVINGWTEWSPYSSCSTSCGYGVQQRHRSCLIPPQLGFCEGGDSEVATCLTKYCDNSSSTIQTRMQSKWSEWTIASFCNVSCGTGVRIRQRQCIRAPQGSNCRGKSVDFHTCQAQACSSQNKNKIGMVILAIVGGLALATFLIVASVCVYWKMKDRSKREPFLFNNQRSQSMQVVFVVPNDDERDQEQGIDNLAMQYDEIVAYNHR